MAFISLNIYTKRAWKCTKKTNLQQNTICLEQQIYADQENFTQPMVLMDETFRKSAPPSIMARIIWCLLFFKAPLSSHLLAVALCTSESRTDGRTQTLYTTDTTPTRPLCQVAGSPALCKCESSSAFSGWDGGLGVRQGRAALTMGDRGGNRQAKPFFLLIIKLYLMWIFG